MVSGPPEPLRDMLRRWWAASQSGAADDAALIIDLWRADAIAAGRDRGSAA